MFEINENHPELKEGEMWVTNSDEGGFAQIHLKTKRMGNIALSSNGDIVKYMFPVFAMKSEMEGFKRQEHDR